MQRKKKRVEMMDGSVHPIAWSKGHVLSQREDGLGREAGVSRRTMDLKL